MNLFLKKLSESLSTFSPQTQALIAVSGGRDSMCLLHGLSMLGCRMLTVCHMNHLLRRGESDSDEKFVTEQAHQLGFPIQLARTDTKKYAAEHKLSLEAAGRQLRYEFFAQTALSTKCSTLFLGHHADDQLETCWWNFLRGTGTAGLAGMRLKSIQKIKGGISLHLIRPFLEIPRTEIIQFACEQKIPFREDHTNTDPRFTRNRIRHELLPFLDKKFGTSHRKAVLRCAEILAKEEDWMKETMSLVPCEPQLSYKALLPLPLALQRRLLHRWLIQQGVPEIGFVEVERVRSLIAPSKTRPAKVNLPSGIHARRRAGILFLEQK